MQDGIEPLLAAPRILDYDYAESGKSSRPMAQKKIKFE
jgi:hypothetical protein